MTFGFFIFFIWTSDLNAQPAEKKVGGRKGKVTTCKYNKAILLYLSYVQIVQSRIVEACSSKCISVYSQLLKYPRRWNQVQIRSQVKEWFFIFSRYKKKKEEKEQEKKEVRTDDEGRGKKPFPLSWQGVEREILERIVDVSRERSSSGAEVVLEELRKVYKSHPVRLSVSS